MLEPGQKVGPYVVVRKLGEGGMGEVYLAEHRHIGRRAAIKILRPEYAVQENAVSRFFTEARAVSMIKHPAIVEIFECDVDSNGCAYLAMEYLEGESLETFLERVGSLAQDLPTAVAITIRVAEALEAAHQQRIIHRDLKPANVFLTASAAGGARPAFEVKVLDFGIAKLAATPDRGTMTRTGSLMGTPVYMSPEQCRGDGAIDHRADIYTLGCMAYEMCCGQPPFSGRASGELLVAHLSDAPPPLSEKNPGIPDGLERAIMSMLKKDPAKRPQTMAEVVAIFHNSIGDVRGVQTLGLPPAPPLVRPRAAEPAPEPIRPQIVSTTVALPDPAHSPEFRAIPGKGTTLSDTASSFIQSHKAPRSRRPLVWIAGGVVLASAMTVGALLAFLPVGRPTPALPAPEEKAVPPPAHDDIEPPAATEKHEEPAPLRIVSAPTGAEVWIDPEGRSRCKTPCELPRSVLGGRVRLVLDGHAPKTVLIPNDQGGDFSVTLERAVRKADRERAPERPRFFKLED